MGQTGWLPWGLPSRHRAAGASGAAWVAQGQAAMVTVPRCACALDDFTPLQFPRGGRAVATLVLCQRPELSLRRCTGKRTEPPRVGWRLRCFGFRFDYSMALAH